MSVSIANGVSEAQRMARHTRSEQAKYWVEAVDVATKLADDLGADVYSYRDFVRAVADKADIDVPTAKRVFDYLESCHVVAYDFGIGVRKPSQTL